MIKKSIVERSILAEVIKIIGNAGNLKHIMSRVEQLVAKMCSTVPEDIWTKKAELSHEQKMVRNFIAFIAEGNRSKSIADSLALSERNIEKLEADLISLELASQNVFKAPPIEWISDRVAHMKEVLEERTEQSALLLRKLLGLITLQPVTPDIGKPYFMAVSKLQPLALLEEKRPQKGPLSLQSKPDVYAGSNSILWRRE